MVLPPATRPGRRSAVALSVAVALFFSGASSLTTYSPVASRFRHDTSGARDRHRRRAAFAAAAADGDGHDDWYVDEDDAVDGDASHGMESAPKLPNGGKDDGGDDVRTYFATCIPGLQETLASELVALGASRVETQGRSGVRFEGSPRVGMKSILWCRTAHKIMELVASSADPPQADEFDFDYENDYSTGIRNREDLYRFVQSAAHTPSLLGDGSGGLLTLSVNTIYASKAPNKELCHGHFTALTVKNALVDAVRDLREDGDRPDVDVDDPDVPLVVVLKGRRADDDFGRRGRRDGRRGDWDDDRSYADEEEEEMVADVDLYRCLHSGGSLHRRGYRRGSLDSSWEGDEGEDEWEADDRRQRRPTNGEAPIHRAAMKETLAAGLLLQAGWDKLVNAARGDGKGAVLVDPMTGSGTLPTEAALIACDVAPGLLRIATWRDGGGGRRDDDTLNPHRRPPCARWKDFGDRKEWDDLLARATRRAKSGTGWARSASDEVPRNVRILCNEVNPRAASLARTSVRNAGVGSIISLSEGDCMDWDLGGGEGSSIRDRQVLEGRTIFVCNPPWGLRLTHDIDESWVSLREFLRREARGCECWVLSGNKDLTKILRMRTSRKVPIRTADEDLRWLQYHIFQRSEVKAR